MSSSGERTEQATPKRKQDARQKGQVAKSMEVNAAIGLLAGIFAMRIFGKNLITIWHGVAVEQFRRLADFDLTTESMRTIVISAGTGYARLVLPILCTCVIAGVASNVLQSGFILSTRPIAMDFTRLNPFQGITRMFSRQAAMDLAKSSIKASLIGYQIFAFFRDNQFKIVSLVQLDTREIGPTILNLCWALLMKAIVVMCVIAAVDYFFQRWQFDRSMRMSKQEVKEEFKSSEGDPLIKSRTRQRQREIARHRMMSDVQKATVVVTNPTHFAIALRYDPTEMAAPQVVAKGQRLIAQKIKEVAKSHGVPVVENPPLARTLFAQCEIGDLVPADLYQAVAEIIAFVFKQAGRVPRHQE